MPRVGTRSFSYTKKGKAAAKRYAKQTGKKLTKAKPKIKGKPKRKMSKIKY